MKRSDLGCPAHYAGITHPHTGTLVWPCAPPPTSPSVSSFLPSALSFHHPLFLDARPPGLNSVCFHLSHDLTADSRKRNQTGSRKLVHNLPLGCSGSRRDTGRKRPSCIKPLLKYMETPQRRNASVTVRSSPSSVLPPNEFTLEHSRIHSWCTRQFPASHWLPTQSFSSLHTMVG